MCPIDDISIIIQVAGTAKNFHEAPYRNEKHKGGIKKVAAVQQTGVGCHKIFSGKYFRGRSKEIRGQNKIVLKEAGFSNTVIK